MRNQKTGSIKQVARPPERVALKAKPPNRGSNIKTDTLRKLLARSSGATVAQIQRRLIWQPHTVRAAISRLRTSGVTVEVDRSGKVIRYRALPEDVGQ